MEFSTPFFEESLPKRGRELEKASDTISSLFKTVRRYQGVLTVLWHPNNMYQSDQFQEIWEGLIKMLRDEETFLSPLMGHLKWQKQRQQITLKEIQVVNEIIRITLSIPENMDSFALHIPGMSGPIHIKNASYKIDREKGILLIQPEHNIQTIDIQLGDI